MPDEQNQDELAGACRELLLGGDFRKAEYLLWEILRARPRAPTTTYLLGLSVLFQRKFPEARRFIDRAYELRLWVDDRIVTPMQLEVLQEASEALPSWDWPRYQLLRERWRAVGPSIALAVEHLTKTSGAPATFVQVGANDGKKGDPIHKLVRGQGLRGLLVEPQAQPFETLRMNYANVPGLVFENAAVADVDGPVEMTVAVDRTTIGSMVPERNILKLRRYGPMAKVTVQGLRFDSILEKHGIRAFDLLQIDTEGFDYRVLRQVDLAARNVKIVNLEYYCLPVAERLAACEQLAAGGFASFFGEMDLLALRRDLFEEPFFITDLMGRVSQEEGAKSA